MFRGWIVGFRYDHVHESAARQFLVKAGGGEIHIPGHKIAWPDSIRERMFSAPRPW